MAAVMGGNIRVGLEILCGSSRIDGQFDAEQVSAARQIVEGLGLEIAGPDEA